MSNTNTERRAHARHVRRFELEGTPDAHGESARMVTSNLSLGGVYCTSSREFEEMTRLAVRMLLPADNPGGDEVEPMDVEAVVVRKRELKRGGGEPQWELALFFTRMDADQRERLARLLDEE